MVGAVVLPMRPAAADGLQDKQRQAATLANRIEQLQQKAELLTEDYNQAVVDLDAAQEDVAGAQARLARQEGDLAGLRTKMANFALRSYVHADQNSLASILDPAVLDGSSAGRSGYQAIAMGTNVDLTDELRATLEDTDRQRVALEARQRRQQQLKDVVAAKRTQVDQASTEAEVALQDVKGDLVALVAAEEQRTLEAAAQRQQVEIDRQRAATAASRSAAVPAGPAGGGAAAAAAPAAAPRPTFSVPPPSAGAAGAVRAALSQVGNRYVKFQGSPETGFDCSGLTSWAWAQAGVGMPHQSRAQFAAFPRVPADQLQPGDLVFSGSPIHHVGIYVGGGQIVHASTPRVGVVVSPIHNMVGAVRPG